MFNLIGGSKKRSKHDREVMDEVQDMRMSGVDDIHADVEGMPDPKERRGREPDIKAEKNGRTVLKEIETPESEGKKHSKKQRKAFSLWEEENPDERDFSVELTDDSIF